MEMTMGTSKTKKIKIDGRVCNALPIFIATPQSYRFVLERP